MRGSIEAVSRLLSGQCNEFLPKDLIEVSVVPRLRAAITVTEEGVHTSGSPWKAGTLGAILQGDRDCFCVTAHHTADFSSVEEPANADASVTPVQVSREAELGSYATVIGGAASIFYKDTDEFDFSFLKLRKPSVGLFSCNMMPLRLEPNLELQDKEDVFKIGLSSGLTIGTLDASSTTWSCPTSQRSYLNHVAVVWKNGCRFSSPGDCGALYCVKRAEWFVPIAIHRISGEGISYGSQFQAALQEFQEMIDDQELAFVNMQRVGLPTALYH
jgi:hypothetical protein